MFERTVEYEACYIGAFPAHAEKYLPTALAWAKQRLDQHGGTLLVVAPSQRQFQDTALSRLPPSVRQETAKTLGRRPHVPPVALVCWPDGDMLERLDSATGLKAMCVLPWLRDELEVWRRARRAEDLLGATPRGEAPAISDPVVEAAMRSVTNSVNLSTGLSHPLDRPKAIWAFKDLKKARYTWDPMEIQTWAMANGWAANDATELAEIAAGVARGKAYRAGTRPWRSDVIQVWRENARRNP